MAFRERIELLIDVATGQSTTAVGRLRTELGNTEGAFNKMKVGASGAFDIIKQHAATAALAAGSALAAFAVKAVGDFQETALGAGQLRDALGVTAEEASKLQEVAGDLGIPVSALESTIGRMNRTAADTPEAFDNIGAAIKRNSDGTTNVTETFLSTVDALNKIPDASKRAAAAQEIFGRSWQDISELVATGADGVRAALEDVEDSKIIDDAEVAKARRFRDTLDELKGVAESLTLEVGERLVPVLTDAAETIQSLVGPTQDVADAYERVTNIPIAKQIYENLAPWEQWRTRIGQVRDVLGLVNDDIKATVGALDPLQGELIRATDAGGGLTAATEDVSESMDDATDAVDDMASATQNLDRKWAALKGQVSDDQAWVDIQDALANVESAAVESFNAAESGAADAAAKARENQSAVNALKERVIDYGREVAGLPPRQVSEIIAMIDRGALAEAERALNNAARARQVHLRAAAVGNFVGPGVHQGTPAFQSGGVATLGEHGPELAFLPHGTKVVGQSETKAMVRDAVGGGTTNVYLNVNVAAGANPVEAGRQIANVLTAYLRTGGAGQIRRELGLGLASAS